MATVVCYLQTTAKKPGFYNLQPAEKISYSHVDSSARHSP
jgi:hypothetical protein